MYDCNMHDVIDRFDLIVCAGRSVIIYDGDHGIK